MACKEAAGYVHRTHENGGGSRTTKRENKLPIAALEMPRGALHCGYVNIYAAWLVIIEPSDRTSSKRTDTRFEMPDSCMVMP